MAAVYAGDGFRSRALKVFPGVTPELPLLRRYYAEK